MQEVNLDKEITRHHEYLASQMLELFSENSVYDTQSNTHQLTEEGFELLHDFFGDVYVNYRSEVFVLFMDMLEANGYITSPADFQEATVQ